MTMAAIGITAAVGAGLSMAKAVIQKKPFGSVLTDGLIGGAIGGVTGGAGLGVSSLLGEGIKQAATPAISGAITDAAAAPLASAATEAASNLATPILSEAAGQSASTIANLAPTFGQSAVEGIGKSAAPSLLAEAPSAVAPSLTSTLNMPSVTMPSADFGQSAMQGLGKGAYGPSGPSLGADLSLSAPSIDPASTSAPWTNADYTAAINAGSQTLNTGMNLAKSPPSGPANYTQNQYGPQSGASGDSLMNSLLNLSRS